MQNSSDSKMSIRKVLLLFIFVVSSRVFSENVVVKDQCPEGVKPGQSVKMPDCSLCTCGPKGYFCYSCSMIPAAPPECTIAYQTALPYPMCCPGTLSCPDVVTLPA